MPTIKLTDGRYIQCGYSKASRTKLYIDEPETLERDIKDADTLAKTKAFLATVADIDFSDIDRRMSSAPVQHVAGANREQIQRVIKDKSLKGKAKFDAMRRAMKGNL